MNKKRNTIIFVVFILIAALGGVLAQRLFLQKTGSYAIVQVSGEVIARMPLSQNAELLVGEEDHGYNRVKTEGGFVFVEEADCPDKICVIEGKIQQTGEVIACLPHELIITVEIEGEEKLDGVAW